MATYIFRTFKYQVSSNNLFPILLWRKITPGCQFFYTYRPVYHSSSIQRTGIAWQLIWLYGWLSYLIATSLHFIHKNGGGLQIILQMDMLQYWTIMADLHSLPSYSEVWYPIGLQWIIGWFSFYNNHRPSLYIQKGGDFNSWLWCLMHILWGMVEPHKTTAA